MRDVEGRIAHELRVAGEQVQVPDDLVGRARARLRRRRAGRTAMMAAAGVAVVSVGLTALGGDRVGGDGQPAPAPADTSEPTPDDTAAASPEGWRTESWRDVQLRVPADWGYGTLTTWCANDGRPEPPVVDRPGGAVLGILCHDPSAGHGVAFGDPAAISFARPSGDVWQYDATGVDVVAHPDGAWLSIWYDDDVSVTISTPSRQLTERIAGSIATFEEADANGCAPTAGVVPGIGSVDTGTGLGALGATDDLVVGRISLCRYAVSDHDSDLVQSELLSEDESFQLVEAVLEAPSGTGPDAGPDSCSGVPEDEAVVARQDGVDLFWVHFSGCDGHGVDLLGGPDSVRRLTEDVMYWALTPGWSGGSAGSVPLPDRLRP